jgi:hypothetical protein
MTRVFPLLLTAILTVPVAASAQVPLSDSERAEALEALGQNPNDARRVQTELRRLLNEHPPSLRIVLQADPSLIDRPDYLAPYPRLAAFLKQHPEIARNPGFFLGQSDLGWYFRERTPQERASEALQSVLAGVAAFTVAMAVLFVVGSLVRQAFGYRRWLRQSRVQTEVHTKILDRLQSNEELLAYIQTPAGQRFLELGPSPKREPEPRAIGAPLGRILWSVQAGVMLLALGIGFWLVQRSAVEELAPAFGAMGTLAAVLGAGAICASATSYVLSARLGLLPAKEAKE